MNLHFIIAPLCAIFHWWCWVCQSCWECTRSRRCQVFGL
uniref:Uncharacterized protein n=1 Tax=Anguilla anguilla TaxID=7936 RepID=A0A0E9Y0L4_ANGAN